MAYRANQTGQAMIESIPILGLLVVFMYGAQLTSRMQINALDLLQDTAVHAFSIHQGQTGIAESHQAFLRNADAAGPRAAKSQLIPDPILSELGIHSPGLMRTTSRLKDARLFGVVTLYRQSHIEVGAGHADSDAAVQFRIAQSDRAWRQAFNTSHTVLKIVPHGSGLVDQPWKRARIDTDWLGKWSGVLPDQKYR